MPRRDDSTPEPTQHADLRDLDRRLSAKIAARKPAQDEGPTETGKAWTTAIKLSGDLLAGLFVGGALGWGIDQLAGTAPWVMLVGLLTGFAAGMRNLIRTAKQIENERPGGGQNE
tara:strand:+ start:495 stop:839 length:345 start_codon:yes stop_codon:yes gene_type:complete